MGWDSSSFIVALLEKRTFLLYVNPSSFSLPKVYTHGLSKLCTSTLPCSLRLFVCPALGEVGWLECIWKVHQEQFESTPTATAWTTCWPLTLTSDIDPHNDSRHWHITLTSDTLLTPNACKTNSETQTVRHRRLSTSSVHTCSLKLPKYSSRNTFLLWFFMLHTAKCCLHERLSCRQYCFDSPKMCFLHTSTRRMQTGWRSARCRKCWGKQQLLREVPAPSVGRGRRTVHLKEGRDGGESPQHLPHPLHRHAVVQRRTERQNKVRWQFDGQKHSPGTEGLWKIWFEK